MHVINLYILDGILQYSTFAIGYICFRKKDKDGYKLSFGQSGLC